VELFPRLWVGPFDLHECPALRAVRAGRSNRRERNPNRRDFVFVNAIISLDDGKIDRCVTGGAHADVDLGDRVPVVIGMARWLFVHRPTYSAAHLRLFRDLLSHGLLHLRDGLCGGRIDGNHDARGRTAGAADRLAAGDGFLPFLQHHSQSEFFAGVLGLNVSVLRADHDADAHRYRDAAVLADSPVAWHRHCDRHWIDLGRVAYLPRRDADDRKESYAAGSVALGETSVSGLRAKSWERYATLPNILCRILCSLPFALCPLPFAAMPFKIKKEYRLNKKQ